MLKISSLFGGRVPTLSKSKCPQSHMNWTCRTAIKKERPFHVNMIALWNNLTTAVLALTITRDDEDPNDIILSNCHREVVLPSSCQLTPDQQQYLRTFIDGWSVLFYDMPGHTSVLEHSIERGSTHPFRLSSYRIAMAWEDEVQIEFRNMLEAGVIEPSKSLWSFPIHVVQKKERSIHICVDYRSLNAVTSNDPYQMPRVDDLIDEVGNATYLSKLDLSKGYYHVAVAEKDCDKTAFITPFGKF